MSDQSERLNREVVDASSNNTHLNDRRFTERRKYDIKHLWERHHEIVRRIALGDSNITVASELGITPQTVSNVRNSPIAKDKIELFRATLDAETLDIRQRIHEFAPKALQLLEDVIEGNIEGVPLALRAKYAHAHLGRAGYGEVRQIQSVSTTLSRDDIERIKERAISAAYEAGVIDVDAASTKRVN